MDDKKEGKIVQYSEEYSQWLTTQSLSNPKVIFTDIWSGISESLMLTAIILYFIRGLQPGLLMYILTITALEIIYKFNLVTLNNEFLFTKLYENMLDEISNEGGNEDYGDAPKDDTQGDDD